MLEERISEYLKITNPKEIVKFVDALKDIVIGLVKNREINKIWNEVKEVCLRLKQPT